MDISYQVYSALDINMTPSRPNIYIDEEAELAKPKPQPLREPRPIYSTEEDEQDKPSKSPGFHPAFDAEKEDDEQDAATEAKRKKHESYNLSGSIFLITGDGKTLKLPIPSASRHDPLTWGRWKKTAAFFALALYSVAALTVVQAASLMMHGIILEFDDEDTKPWTPETLVTAPTLFMGVGAFLWVPLSLALGRRPVFLLSALLMFVATLGAGHSKTFHQLLLFLSLLGMCEGFALTLALLIVIDMTFISQRPKAIGAIWSVAGFIGTGELSLVPYLSDHGNNWRLFYQRWSIMSAICFLAAFLLFPETYFKRPTVAFDGLILLQSATEKLTVYEDVEANSELYRDLPEPPNEDHEPTLPRRLVQRIALTRSHFGSWKAMGRCYLQIAFCAINPLIFWVLVASSVNFAGMMYIGTTYGQILSAPPYSLPSELVIFVNNCSGIGGLLAFPAVSVVGHLLTKLSKRNGGVREAEHYLIGYILPVISGCLSTLIYGLAVHYRWHFGFFYLAYGLNGLSWVSISIANTLWVTEVFPRWAAPALVVVGGGCYLISFSMTFGLIPWIEAQGFLLVGVELTVLQFVGGLITLPIAFWGKSARQKIHGRWASERSGALRPL